MTLLVGYCESAYASAPAPPLFAVCALRKILVLLNVVINPLRNRSVSARRREHATRTLHPSVGLMLLNGVPHEICTVVKPGIVRHILNGSAAKGENALVQPVAIGAGPEVPC